MVMKKKGGKLIAAILTSFCLITIAWLSCTKVKSDPYTCNYVTCDNGGYCHKDTVHRTVGCLCPVGYEGSKCEIVSATKYLNAWDVTETIVGTDSPAFKNLTFHYIAYLEKSPTTTTFLFNNWSNNQYYNNIICTIDSANSYKFVIDTLSSWHLLYDHYRIISGSGMITKTDSLITGNMVTRHLSVTSNWINDTFVFYMTQHH
jgi:hypothetical protein